MTSVALFAFVLFVMGGVTAYMGDRLGSYIGKKRHSSFGLRPRHTAMLWTVISGGAIAVGTLALLFVLDNTVKTALMEGPELVAQKAILEHQNAALTRRNAATEKQVQEDNLRAIEAQKSAAQAQGELGAVAKNLKRAMSTLAMSRITLDRRQHALGQAQSQLIATQTGLSHTKLELREAEARVRFARQGLSVAQRQYQIADAQVIQANKSVLSLVIQQDRLHTENDRLTKENQVQDSLLQASQAHSLIYRRDEELGRTVIASHQPLESLRRELAVFLDQIELTARQHGAGGTDNSPAISIPAAVEGAEGGPAAREAALDALSQNIADQSPQMPSIVIVADARYNTFRGDIVKVDIRPYANLLVYPKDTLIADSEIDGNLPDDDILKQLQSFLIERVRSAALNRGIIPILDPESGTFLVGQPIDSATWLDLVKQIRTIGHNAHVTASAAEDTYSGDLLRLDLRALPKAVPTSAAVPEKVEE